MAIARGAERLAGGARVGAVVPPTLLAGVDDSMAVGCQEIFGPVMSLRALRHARRGDRARQRHAVRPGHGPVHQPPRRCAARGARGCEVGGVHINETSSSRVDVMPYGGSKDSGFGREGPHHAVREMSEERMVTLLA